MYWPDSLCLYWKARTYADIDPWKARDTMQRYCQEHPFATLLPGEVLSGFGWVIGFTADISFKQPGGPSTKPWIETYNWFVDMQPLNPELKYQEQIFSGLASAASEIDWNLECDLLYTYLRMFGHDPAVDTNSVWRQIQSIRASQLRGEMDTTPLRIIILPLKKLPFSAVAQAQLSDLDASVSPNPVTSEAVLKCTLPEASVMQVTLGGVLGMITTLYNGMLEAGEHKLRFQLTDLPRGVYYLIVIINEKSRSLKLVVI